jgi:hypothetical protein
MNRDQTEASTPGLLTQKMRVVILAVVGVFGFWVCTLGYFSSFELVTGFFNRPLVHFGLGICAVGYLAIVVMNTPYLRHHAAQRLAATDPLSRRLRHMEVFLFFLLIPFLVTIPLSTGLNRAFDTGDARNLQFTVANATFVTKGALETRRCHIRILDDKGETYLLKVRPALNECQRIQVGDSLEVTMRSGFLNTPWILALRWPWER